MERLFIEQGSDLWKEYRRSRVSATDIAVITGVSPWSSPYQLWSRKLGLIPDTNENDAMRRGKALEPVALELYCTLTGKDVSPVTVVKADNSRFMASLDGLSDDGKHLVEIKCPGKANHDEAKDGIVKPLYIAQMQWQMYITGLDKCDYFSFDGSEGVIITVVRDDDFIESSIKKAKEFLFFLDRIEPPPFTDLDYVDMSQDHHWEAMMRQYAEYETLEKHYKEQKESLKQQAISHANGRNVRGSVSKYTAYTMKGAVEYSKVPELQGVDLEVYRKPPVQCYKITITKD